MRALGFLVLLMSLCAAMPARAETTLERVRRTGELAIGSDATYPPFESVRGSRFEGFDIDLGEAIAADLGVRARWVNTGFDGIFPALGAGKFDAVMSSVTITEERKRQLAFSDPYYTAGQILAIQGDAEGVKGLDDLAGKTAGIQINTTAALILKKYPAVKVRSYPTIDLALQDLANGNIQAVVGDAPTIKYFLTRGFPQLQTVGALLTEEHYGIAMRPSDRELVDAVNGALKHLRDSGQFQKLEEKWFGKEAQAREAEALAQRSQGTPWGLILGKLAEGLWLTIRLTLAALVLGLPIGIAIALGRKVRFAPVAWFCAAYVEFLRGTPLLVQIMFVYYALPKLIGLNLESVPAAILALTLNCGAYLAEIFRAGIDSIDRGQMEAARSLGMTYGMGMRYVVLPQAFRRVLPPLTNEAIALLKDSSLVSIIALAELTRSGQELASQLAEPLKIWPLVGLMYLAVTFPLSRLAAALERRWAAGGH